MKTNKLSMTIIQIFKSYFESCHFFASIVQVPSHFAMHKEERSCGHDKGFYRLHQLISRSASGQYNTNPWARFRRV